MFWQTCPYIYILDTPNQSPEEGHAQNQLPSAIFLSSHIITIFQFGNNLHLSGQITTAANFLIATLITLFRATIKPYDWLEVGDQSEHTYTTTYTVIRRNDFWWMNHQFWEQHEQLYAIKFRYGEHLNWFQALCSASHQVRNIFFSHYFSMIVKRRVSAKYTENSVNFVLRQTKRSYLNSLIQGIKMFEQLHL